jgi:HAD superfamily hydrolase (TIGR01509 family)
VKKLIIFDFDGTLVDSAGDVAYAFAHAARTAGKYEREIPPAEVMPHMGKNLSEMFEAVLPAENHRYIQHCVNAYRTFYRENCTRTTVPFPGVLDLLTELRARGIKTAIASNKLHPVITHVVGKLELTHYFDHIQGIEDFPAKPAPHMLRYVLQRFDVTPDEALMVGDTDNDVLAAQRAGIAVCAVSWGGAWDDLQLADLRPDNVCNTIEDLRSAIYA